MIIHPATASSDRVRRISKPLYRKYGATKGESVIELRRISDEFETYGDSFDSQCARAG